MTLVSRGAGRIKHHLRRNIGRPECTILFVGYQAPGTLGRRILDRDKSVRIHGKEYPLRAQIAQIYGFSGHADQSDLLQWLDQFHHLPERLFLNHGDEHAAFHLKNLIQDRFDCRIDVPEYLGAVHLT